MVLISGAPFAFLGKTRFLPAKREWCRQQWQAKSKKRSRMSLHRHRGLFQRLINEQRVLLDLFNWMLGVGRLLEDFSSSLPLTSHLSPLHFCSLLLPAVPEPRVVLQSTIRNSSDPLAPVAARLSAPT